MRVADLSLNRYRWGLCVLIFASLLCIYLLVYSARIESGDTLRLFDSASSWVQYGDYGRDESLWFTPPVRIPLEDHYPLGTPEEGTEFSVGLAAILYRLGLLLPQVGLAHLVWLLNPLLAAVAGGVFFWVVLALEYDEKTALLAALVFGTTTIVIPYTQSLFREMQVLVFLLLAVLGVLQWRNAATWRGLGWLVGAGLALVAAYLAKESVSFALPALVVLLLPALPPSFQKLWGRLAAGLLILLVGGFTLFVYNEAVFNSGLQLLQPILERLHSDTTYSRVALHTYLYSAGGSIWGSSPIVLLGLFGLRAWWRAGKSYVVWFVVLLLLGYAGGHAFLTGIHWFGGLSWPPRFLVPTIPYVFLLTLPVWQYVLSPACRWWWRVGVGIVIVYSVWIQFMSVALLWSRYITLLPPNLDPAPPDVPFEWLDGLNQLEYVRWVLPAGDWVTEGFNFAWTRAGVDYWLLIWAGLALLWAGLAAWLVRRGKIWRYAVVGGIVPLLITFGAMYGALRVLTTADTYFWGYKTALWDVLAYAQQHSAPDDILLLADDTYMRFMMNFQRLPYPRPLVLPLSPGERLFADDPDVIQSANPIDYIQGDKFYFNSMLLDWLPMRRDRVWVLAHTTPFLPWSVRPIERYLGLHHYRVQVVETSDPTVRLLEYDLTRAPDVYFFTNPEQLTDLRYGEHIALQGYTLPKGETYQAGAVLPITLRWITDAPLRTDYVVAWFVFRADGTMLPLQGIDTMPYDGFAPTTTWQPNVPVQDNHALRLPADLPAGEYRIWVILYSTASGTAERLTVTGAEVQENTIGILPTIIQVK